LLFQDLFLHSQVKSSLIFGTDEEEKISAAFRCIFVQTRVRGCAKKAQRDPPPQWRARGAGAYSPMGWF